MLNPDAYSTSMGRPFAELAMALRIYLVPSGVVPDVDEDEHVWCSLPITRLMT
jgi:hypothetical protein